jgi:sec-independent protein translocase protein TatA
MLRFSRVSQSLNAMTTWLATSENVELTMDIGPTELIIILIIVVLLFGVGRIGKIAGELGSGIRAFREGLQGSDEEKKPTKTDEQPSTSEPVASKESEQETETLKQS